MEILDKNVVERERDQIRTSIREINFVSEPDPTGTTRAEVVQINYQIQTKNPKQVIDTVDGPARPRIQLIKKASESFWVATEPLFEDLMYINKIISEHR